MATTQRSALADGLRHYIVRPDKNMVPLVPADQLPYRLHGVPLQLSHEQLSKENWKFVTDTQTPSYRLAIQAPAANVLTPPASPGRKHFAPDHNVRIESNATLQPPKMNQETPRNGGTGKPTPLARVTTDTEPPDSLSALQFIVPTKPKPRVCLPPSGILPDPKKKEYCSYWLRTGECDFIAQGCLYKHEMPDREKLRQLGFTRGYPLWYQEKRRLRNYKFQPKLEDEEPEYSASDSTNKRFGIFKSLREESEHEAVPYQSQVDEEKLVQNVPDQPQGEETGDGRSFSDHTNKVVCDLIDLDDPPTPAPTRHNSTSAVASTPPESDTPGSSSDSDSCLASLRPASRASNLGPAKGSKSPSAYRRRPTHPAYVLYRESTSPNRTRKQTPVTNGLATSKHATPSTKPVKKEPALNVVENKPTAQNSTASMIDNKPTEENPTINAGKNKLAGKKPATNNKPAKKKATAKKADNKSTSTTPGPASEKARN